MTYLVKAGDPTLRSRAAPALVVQEDGQRLIQLLILGGDQLGLRLIGIVSLAVDSGQSRLGKQFGAHVAALLAPLVGLLGCTSRPAG